MMRGTTWFVGLALSLVLGCGEAGTGSAGVGGSGGTAGVGGTAGRGGTAGNGGTAGSGGTGGGPPGTVPMFVAQGHAGRTIISCDDGRTWVADQSDHAGVYCAPDGSADCDHDPGAGRGITWGDGWFFANFGWGAPGSVRRSRDGVAWETVYADSYFAGMAFGNGRLVAADRWGEYSDDDGDNWSSFADVGLPGDTTVRDTAFVPYGGGRFIMSADAGVAVSSDGSTWTNSNASGCSGGDYQGHVIYGNGTVVMTPSGGNVCYSTDGGQNWSSASGTGPLRTNGIWNGSEFMAWGVGTLYRSSDGQSWTSTPTVPGNIDFGDFGVTGVSDQGTIVGVNGGWEQSYGAQRFYRSTDGVNWEELPSNAYTGGHPIHVIAFGYGAPSAYCP